MENQTTSTEKTEEKKAAETNTYASKFNWGAMALALLAGGAIGYLASRPSSNEIANVNDESEIDDSDRVERWELKQRKQEKKLKEEKRIATEKQAAEIKRQQQEIQQEKIKQKLKQQFTPPQKKSSTYIQIK
ncbi:MAG: hypothetical protein RL065_2095 [Bacteroidota bacterium]|jgi:hypothetical protein